MTESHNAPQPPPQQSDRQACWTWVLRCLHEADHPGLIADIKERDRLGTEKYGTPLQPFNGRDALIDHYQEMLDATVYMAQVAMERGSSENMQQFAGTLELLKRAHRMVSSRKTATGV